MKKYKHPLAEVFGFKITDQSVAAKKHRNNKKEFIEILERKLRSQLKYKREETISGN